MGKKQSTRFKTTIYERFARIGKAISSPGVQDWRAEGFPVVAGEES